MDTSNVATRSTSRVSRLVALTLAAGAFSFLGTVAVAQNSSGSEGQSTVTVQAPRVVHKSAGVGANGLALEQLSLTREVSFADLNLDTPEGKVALHDRIRSNAREACQQLAALYPFSIFTDDVQTCVQNAMLTWMPQVHALAPSAAE